MRRAGKVLVATEDLTLAELRGLAVEREKSAPAHARELRFLAGEIERNGADTARELMIRHGGTFADLVTRGLIKTPPRSEAS
ncbi:MAG TPA: hypothetical protein VGH28_26895 [Polyangiaceae bacterium]